MTTVCLFNQRVPGALCARSRKTSAALLHFCCRNCCCCPCPHLSRPVPGRPRYRARRECGQATCPRWAARRPHLGFFKEPRYVGLLLRWHRLKLFRMASHLSSVLAKCTFEDVEFLAIVQVRHCHITASRSFAAHQKSIRSTLLGCCVFAATRPRDRYLLPVAFLKLPHARSVTLIISRQSARSCHR